MPNLICAISDLCGLLTFKEIYFSTFRLLFLFSFFHFLNVQKVLYLGRLLYWSFQFWILSWVHLVWIVLNIFSIFGNVHSYYDITISSSVKWASLITLCSVIGLIMNWGHHKWSVTTFIGVILCLGILTKTINLVSTCRCRDLHIGSPKK